MFDLGDFLLGAAALAAAVFLTVYVVGQINRSSLEQKLRSKNIKKAIIKEIDRCNNVVKLKDLDNDRTLEVRGDSVSLELYEGQLIYSNNLYPYIH